MSRSGSPGSADGAAAAARPLAGRVALVTGVSRRVGIGAAITARLLSDGARVLATGWPPHDAELLGSASADEPESLLAELSEAGAAGSGDAGERLAYERADFEDPACADALVRSAARRFGGIDIVVANHARSSNESLLDVSARELDRCWAVNARASVLLAQSLARVRPEGEGGRLVLFTSGQHRGPMSGEIAYAVSKGAIHQMTASLSDALMERGITVNCINPGPVDTAWADGELHREVEARFPGGRWGTPEDVARLVAWLVADEASWITGQVIDSEGGFRRS